MHIHILHTLCEKIVRSASGLAQVRSPRLGEGTALAQAAGSRLGETANRGLGRFCELSLRRGHLAWARWCVAQNSIFRWASTRPKTPRRASATLAWARRTRLDENNSSLSLFHACKARDSSKTPSNAYSFHHEHHTITGNAKQNKK